MCAPESESELDPSRLLAIFNFPATIDASVVLVQHTHKLEARPASKHTNLSHSVSTLLMINRTVFACCPCLCRHTMAVPHPARAAPVLLLSVVMCCWCMVARPQLVSCRTCTCSTSAHSHGCRWAVMQDEGGAEFVHILCAVTMSACVKVGPSVRQCTGPFCA